MQIQFKKQNKLIFKQIDCLFIIRFLGYWSIFLTISMCDNLQINSNSKFIQRELHSLPFIKVFVGFELGLRAEETVC